MLAGWDSAKGTAAHAEGRDVRRRALDASTLRSSRERRAVPKRAASIRLRRRVKTTIPDQSGRRLPDLIERDFSIGEPNRRYVGDITYVPIADGTNLYLATCIDLGSRKLAGWQVADHMRTELVEDALRAAARDRGSLAGAVFHSDHGSVGEFNWSSQHLDRGGVQQWRQRIGSRRRARFLRVRVGSGVRIERCGRRCVRLDDLSPRGRCSGSSGV